MIAFRASAEPSGLDVSWTHTGSVRPLDQTVHLNLWTYRRPTGNSEVILQKLEVLPLP
jgi:hypothetical protein